MATDSEELCSKTILRSDYLSSIVITYPQNEFDSHTLSSPSWSHNSEIYNHVLGN